MPLFLDEETQKRLDESMQQGYARAMDKDVVAVCHKWLATWQEIKRVMEEAGFASIEELEQAFQGKESIYNWASVFELELGLAAQKLKSFAQKRIDFCSEFMERYRKQEDILILNMKQAIAASYFRLGQAEEGDRHFSRYLKETPHWGGGWIAWADQYWHAAVKENKNRDKAVYILKKALALPELEDREEVAEKLKEIYAELGLQEDLDGFIIDGHAGDLEAMAARLREGKAGVLPSWSRPGGANGSINVGRNDPCPCGSGRKYKRCCMS